MNEHTIELGDWQRILLGDAPALFLLEVLARSAVVYLMLVVALRLLGKRMTGQVTILEMSVMIALGGVVSLPMQAPDRGILVAASLLLCILALQRGLSRLGVSLPLFERALQGRSVMLVKDGVLQVEELASAALSREQVFAVLREHDVHELGQVKRAYLEPCGAYSIFKRDQPMPGLSIFPARDRGIHDREKSVNGQLACASCGHVRSEDGASCACPHCGMSDWTRAVSH